MSSDRRNAAQPRQDGDKTHVAAPLTLSVKNFGPISNGTITLRPLTVLIGPSNSGKSYIAKLAYRMNRSCQIMCRGFNVPYDPFLLRSGYAETAPNKYTKIMSKIQNHVRKGSHKRNLLFPTSLLSQFHRTITLVLPDILASELRKEFGGNVGTLTRFSTNGFSAKISGSLNMSISWSRSMAAACESKKKTTYCVVRDPLTRVVALKATSSGNSEIFPIQERSFVMIDPEVSVHLVAMNLARAIVGRTAQSFLESLETQFFFSLSSPTLQRLAKSTEGDHKSDGQPLSQNIDEPSLSGLPDDFVSTVVSIDPNVPGPLFDLAKKMENELLGGTISLSKLAGKGIPTISLKINKHTVTLKRMSSHASSLALLVVYLKFVIAPGQRIIIEEPESHMSPANQLIFAKYVTLLIRRGVRVTIITHSILLFERLSAHMVLGSLDKKKRKLVVPDTEAYLNLDEVSAHQFHVKSPGNCTISDIPSSRSGGIDQEQFGRLSFEMYDERSRIQEKLEELTDDPE